MPSPFLPPLWGPAYRLSLRVSRQMLCISNRYDVALGRTNGIQSREELTVRGGVQQQYVWYYRRTLPQLDQTRPFEGHNGELPPHLHVISRARQLHITYVDMCFFGSAILCHWSESRTQNDSSCFRRTESPCKPCSTGRRFDPPSQ